MTAPPAPPPPRHGIDIVDLAFNDIYYDPAPAPFPQWSPETATDLLSEVTRAHNRALLVMAAECTPEPDADVEAHLSELSARLSVPRHRAEMLTDIGLFLRRFPVLARRIAGGFLGPDHLTMLARSVTGVSPEDDRGVEGDLLVLLAPRRDGLALPGVAALRNRVRRVIAERDLLARPLEPSERTSTETCSRQRRIDITEGYDPGTTVITATLPTEEAEEFTLILDAVGRKLDCSRSAALMHLAHGTADVQVTLNLYRDPESPVAATQAGTWLDAAATDTFMERVSHLRILAHESTGTYTPTEAIVAFVRGRDGTCRHPGCDVPADRCQIDHIMRHQGGGPTATRNLHCLCQRHHLMKTMGWQDITMAPDGTEMWTSIGDGHIYLTEPTGPLAAYARSTFSSRATRRYRTLREHNERRLAEQHRVREAVTSVQDASARDSEEVPF